MTERKLFRAEMPVTFPDLIVMNGLSVSGQRLHSLQFLGLEFGLLVRGAEMFAPEGAQNAKL